MSDCVALNYEQMTDADREATIRKWAASKYPPDFPPMDDPYGAIKFLIRRLDEERAVPGEESKVPPML